MRLSGFIAQPAAAKSALAIIAAHRVSLSDEDESLADDLPPAVAYLHWADERVGETLVACRQAAHVTGRLQLGAMHEVDGRISFVRLQVDHAKCAG